MHSVFLAIVSTSALGSLSESGPKEFGSLRQPFLESVRVVM
jgi:hypothetical protein